MTTEIAGATVWNGHRALGPATVTWSGGVITRVTPLETPQVTPHDSASRASEDAVEFSIIPGLIDTHVHLIGSSTNERVDFLTWPLTTRPEEQVLHGLANARAALAQGVTTLRDLSANDVQFSLRRAIEKGVVEGPRVLAHGMVSMTGGHGDMFTPAAVTNRPTTADGVDACRALVRHWARSGADGIKIATSGGVLSQGDKASWRNHTQPELDAIVDEAHALGMLVAAHAHTADGITRALDAGVDSIEHGTLVDPSQFARIIDVGVTIAPTLLINEAIASGRLGSPEEQMVKAAALVAARDGVFRAAADAGVDFVLGTDANGFHVRFGDQMEEARRMSQVFGYSAERTLQAATSRAAAAIGMAGSIGVLDAGASADLVIMRGRPWESIADLDVTNIVAVVAGGTVVHGAIPAALE